MIKGEYVRLNFQQAQTRVDSVGHRVNSHDMGNSNVTRENLQKGSKRWQSDSDSKTDLRYVKNVVATRSIVIQAQGGTAWSQVSIPMTTYRCSEAATSLG